eukprot:5708141-Pyramimonas_sp.AAC.1
MSSSLAPPALRPASMDAQVGKADVQEKQKYHYHQLWGLPAPPPKAGGTSFRAPSGGMPEMRCRHLGGKIDQPNACGS